MGQVIDGGCGRMAEILEAELNKLGVFVEYRSELTNLEVTAVKSSNQRITRMEFNAKHWSMSTVKALL